MSKVGLAPTATIGLSPLEGVADQRIVTPNLEVGIGESQSIQRHHGSFLSGARVLAVGIALFGAFFLSGQASAQSSMAGAAQGQIERTQGQPRLQSMVIAQSESQVRLDDPAALRLIAGPSGSWNVEAKVPLASLDSSLQAAIKSGVPIQEVQAFGPFGQRGESTGMTFRLDKGVLTIATSDIEPGMWKKVPPRILVQLGNGDFHMVVLTAPKLTRDFSAERKANVERSIAELKTAIHTLENDQPQPVSEADRALLAQFEAMLGRQTPRPSTYTNRQFAADLRAQLLKLETELKGDFGGSISVIDTEHGR